MHLEAAHDAVIDFKLKELGKGSGNTMRIRTMRNVTYNSERHPLKIGDNFAINLDESKRGLLGDCSSDWGNVCVINCASNGI